MTKTILRALLCACALSAGTVGTAHADGTAAPTGILPDALSKLNKDAKDKNLFTFDYGIPTSPALTLAGTSTDKSAPSTSLKPFVFSVPASWGGSKDSQAFSLDFSAMWALQKVTSLETPTYDKYLESGFLGQLPYRTRLEGALFLGDDGSGDVSKAKKSRLAFGLSMSLLSDSDPITARTSDGTPVWSSCVDGVFSGAKVDQYHAEYNSNPNVKVLNALFYVQSDVNDAIKMGGDDRIAAAFNSLQNCLQAGHACEKYDGGGKLAQAVTARNLTNASAEVERMISAVQTAVSKDSQDISTKLGVPAALDACVAKANAAARLGADLDIGGGVVWSGTPGKVDGFSDASGALWIAGRFPIAFLNPKDADTTDVKPDAQSFLLTGSLRAAWNESLSTGNSATPFYNANDIDAWIGLERDTASSRITAQFGYTDARAAASAFKSFNKSSTRWQVSASMKLGNILTNLLNGSFLIDQPASPPSNGLWVNATYGSSNGTLTNLDDKTFMVSLSYSPSAGLFGDADK